MENILKNYLETNGFKPTPWAKKHGIAPPVISRYFHGCAISKENALRIEQATDGAVTRMELLYPEKDQARETERGN